MKRRILSFVLVLALALTLVVPAISVHAVPGGVKFTITPDKREVIPGDIVTYTVRMGAAERWGALTIYLELPEGLTIVPNSLVKAPDLAALSTVFTPNEAEPLVLIETNDLVNGCNTPEMDMIIFKCTVGPDASGVLEVGMTDPGDDFCSVDIERIDADVSELNSAITVKAVPVPATGLSLNKTTLSLAAGSEETLTATVTPDNTTDPVTWTSGNTDVALVDNAGKVTAVAPGTAVITAAAGTHSAQCTVTVTCAHTLETVDAQASTCLVQGWDAYQKCTLCGQLFDMEGNEIDAVPYLPLAEHTYGELIEEVPAACETEGVKAHYHCSVCGKDFDEAHNELTDLTIPALGHNPGSQWKHDDDKHWHECGNGCGTKLDEAAHTWTWVVDQAPTEDAEGVKHEQCPICGAVRNENTPIDKLDHVHFGITHHEAVPATCTTTGYVEYWTCASDKCQGIYYGDADCTTVLDTIVVPIDPANHAGGTEIRNAKEATCTEPGYTGDTYCLGCQEKIADGQTIQALGHDFSVPQKDATHHWNKCSRCDAIDAKIPHSDADGQWDHDENGHWHECSCGTVIDQGEHTYGAWETTEAPTTEKTGKEVRSCTVCGHTQEREIPMLNVYTVEVPLQVVIQQTGNTAPEKETFRFEILGQDENAQFTVLLDTLTAEDLTFADGKATVKGSVKLQAVGDENLALLTEGILIRMEKGTSEGWTYAEEAYQIYLQVEFPENTESPVITEMEIYAIPTEDDEEGQAVDEMTFQVEYLKNTEPDPTEPDPTEKPEPTDPEPTDKPEPTKPAEKPETPKTSDSAPVAALMVLSILALGGMAVLTVIGKKKSI